MTSKLKCPVCGEPLGILLCDVDDFVCKKCRMTGDEKLWQALIQAKQDLEIARNALIDIFFICEQDASKDANTRVSEIYAIAKKVLEHKD